MEHFRNLNNVLGALDLLGWDIVFIRTALLDDVMILIAELGIAELLNESFDRRRDFLERTKDSSLGLARKSSKS